MSIEHCWHNVSLAQGITDSMGYHSEKRALDVCCHCGGHQQRTDRLRIPEGHGKHFPLGTSYGGERYSEVIKPCEHPCIESQR